MCISLEVQRGLMRLLHPLCFLSFCPRLSNVSFMLSTWSPGDTANPLNQHNPTLRPCCVQRLTPPAPPHATGPDTTSSTTRYRAWHHHTLQGLTPPASPHATGPDTTTRYRAWHHQLRHTLQGLTPPAPPYATGPDTTTTTTTLYLSVLMFLSLSLSGPSVSLSVSFPTCRGF